MNEIIIDSCVILDIFIESRSRHIIAKSLADFLIKNKIFVKIPFFSLFEIASGIKREQKESFIQFQKSITEKRQLKINPIPIDNVFIKKYFDSTLPYSKAGDLLFLSIAKKDNDILITEDKKLNKRAKKCNIEVYSINEFLHKFNGD